MCYFKRFLVHFNAQIAKTYGIYRNNSFKDFIFIKKFILYFMSDNSHIFFMQCLLIL